MIYALDANTISFLLRPSKNPEVVQQFERIVELGHDYVIPPISHYEVQWNLLLKKAEVQVRLFNRLVDNSRTELNISEVEILKAAEVRAGLAERGLAVGAADIFIAVHCIINGYTLVTDNTKDFQKIDGLNFVNWKGRS